jgi:glyoxylase-like metal-dependent hydrolase (beta-lactamase superfamily II)
MPAAEVVQVPLTVMGPRGVNAFVVTGARPMIVDAGIPGSAPQIIDALARLGFTPDAVALIVITHAHVDHAGDARALQQATGAPVAVHRLDAPAIADGTSAPVRGRTPEAQAMLEQLGSAPAPPFLGLEADIVVDDAFELSAVGLDGTLIHTPGHTDGGLTLLVATGEAIVGDLIGSDVHDPALAALGPFATDEKAMLASVRRLLSLEPTRIYCGHGGPFGTEFLTPLRASLGLPRGALTSASS